MSAPGNVNNLFTGGAGDDSFFPVNPAYQIKNSLSLEAGYLQQPITENGSKQKGTLSLWVYRTRVRFLTGTCTLFRTYNPNTPSDYDEIALDQSGSVSLTRQGTGSQTFGVNQSTFLLDQTAWYHILLAWDTTQPTESDRIKLYVNGIQQPLTVTCLINTEFKFNTLSFENQIGSTVTYLKVADVYFIDNNQYSSTDFGYVDNLGVWQPKAFEGSYGTNGFHLSLDDASGDRRSLADSGPNGKNFTNGLNISFLHPGPVSIPNASYGALPCYQTADVDFAQSAPAGARADENADILKLNCPCINSDGTNKSPEDLYIAGRTDLQKFVAEDTALFIGSEGHHYNTVSMRAANSADYFRWANNLDFQVGTGNILQLETWYQMRSVDNTDCTIFHKSNNTLNGNSSNIEYALLFDANVIQVRSNLGTQNHRVVASYTLPPQYKHYRFEWHHIVLSIDTRTSGSIFVSVHYDGVPIITNVDAVGDMRTSTSNSLYIGGGGGIGGSDRCFQDFRVYKTSGTPKYLPGVGFRVFQPEYRALLVGFDGHVTIDSPQTFGDYKNQSNPGGILRGNYNKIAPRPSNSSGNRETPVTSSMFRFYTNPSSNNNLLYLTGGYFSRKYYYEVTIPGLVDPDFRLGMGDKANMIRYTQNSNLRYNDSNSFEWRPNGQYYGGASGNLIGTGAYWQSTEPSKILGFDVDLDQSVVRTYVDNNIDQVIPIAGPDNYQLCVYKTTNTQTVYVNAGQFPYAYPAPTGSYPGLAALGEDGPRGVSGIYRGNNNLNGSALNFRGEVNRFDVNGTGILYPDIIRTAEGLFLNTTDPSINASIDYLYNAPQVGIPYRLGRGVINQ